MMGDGSDQNPPQPSHVHIYVDDVDKTYKRALAMAASSIQAPAVHGGEDKDRRAGVKYAGISFWMGTSPASASGVPPGHSIVSPYFLVTDGDDFIKFLQQVFEDGKLLMAVKTDDGRLRHAEFQVCLIVSPGHTAMFFFSLTASSAFLFAYQVDDSTLMLGESKEPDVCHFHAYVPNALETHAKALKAGAKNVKEPAQGMGDDTDIRGSVTYKGIEFSMGTTEAAMKALNINYKRSAAESHNNKDEEQPAKKPVQ